MHFISAREKRVRKVDQVSERPNLSFMRVAREHQPPSRVCHCLYVPGGMRDKYGSCARRTALEGFLDEVAGLAAPSAAREVVDTGQDQAWPYLSPAIMQHVNAIVFEHPGAACVFFIELVIASDCPHSKRSTKRAQRRQQLAFRRIVALGDVTRQDDYVRTLSLYLPGCALQANPSQVALPNENPKRERAPCRPFRLAVPPIRNCGRPYLGLAIREGKVSTEMDVVLPVAISQDMLTPSTRLTVPQSRAKSPAQK